MSISDKTLIASLKWVGTTQNYIDANDAKVKADFIKAAEWLEAWQ